MKLYSNVYDYAIYTQIISCRLILNTFFAHSKNTITARIPKLLYVWSKHICLNYVLPLLFICVRFYEY